MRSFSEEFKKSSVQKLLSRGSRSVKDIERETGVGSCSLYQWAKQLGDVKPQGMKKTDRRPQDWNSAEKLKAVFEFESMVLDKRGEYLRRVGLDSEHIEIWKKSMQMGLEPEARSKSERADSAAAAPLGESISRITAGYPIATADIQSRLRLNLEFDEGQALRRVFCYLDDLSEEEARTVVEKLSTYGKKKARKKT